MYSTRLFQLLVVALGFTYVTQATPRYDERGIMIPREDDPIGDVIASDESPGQTPASSTPEATSTDDNPPSSTSSDEPPSSTSDEPSPTSTEQSTSDPPPETSTPDAPTSSTTMEETPASTSSISSTSSTTSEPDPTSTEDKSSSKPSATSEEPVVSTVVDVVTTTNSDGNQETMTTKHVTTSTPAPQDGDKNGGGSGGMSSGTRNIVIGVVVGIGGAILLGALGVVAWRIRSRKKAAEENEHLMEYTSGYTQVDKSEPPDSATGTNPSTTGRSPFQSTLDTYHQPDQINTSSNF